MSLFGGGSWGCGIDVRVVRAGAVVGGWKFWNGEDVGVRVWLSGT